MQSLPVHHQHGSASITILWACNSRASTIAAIYRFASTNPGDLLNPYPETLSSCDESDLQGYVGATRQDHPLATVFARNGRSGPPANAISWSDDKYFI